MSARVGLTMKANPMKLLQAHRTIIEASLFVSPRVFSMQGVGARGDLPNHPRRASIPLPPFPRLKTEENTGNPWGLPPAAFIGRNPQFHSLTLAEREHLGGAEYRAITLLAIIVPMYLVLWQLLGSLGLGAYIARNRASTTLQNGFSP